MNVYSTTPAWSRAEPQLDLLSTDEADDFYRAVNCADFQGFRRHSKEDTGSRSSKCREHNALCTGKKEF